MDISTWKRTPQNTPFLGHDKEGPGREEVQRKTLRKTFGALARPEDRDQGGCAGDLPPGRIHKLENNRALPPGVSVTFCRPQMVSPT